MPHQEIAEGKSLKSEGDAQLKIWDVRKIYEVALGK